MKMDSWSIMDSALEALGQNDKADVEHYIRELGRENVELKIEADTMRQHHKNAEAVCVELHKDKERLDWLLKEASIAYVCWSIDSREQIDEEMRGTEL